MKNDDNAAAGATCMTDIISKAYAHAKREYPYECCGILLGKSVQGNETVITDYVPADNENLIGKRTKHFYIDPLKFYEKEKKYSEQGLDIIGIVHSHPDAEARPSSEDEKNMIPGLLYLIIEVRKGESTGHRFWQKDRTTMNVSEVLKSFEKF
ncbi:MAG: M67 family metallopeptidase [Lachnospiraceae bacterium]|nr:M67 family metallopeptidase [Lachnospiraceae bacterium]